VKNIKWIIALTAILLGSASGVYAADFWLEDFTGGTQGQLPTNWMDNSTNPGFNARIVYTSTGGTYADVTVVAGAFGKALSPVQILNTTVFPKLEIKVAGVDAAAALETYIQEQTGAYRHWPVDHDQYITGPGTFVFDLPTVTGVSGPLTFSVETTVSGGTWKHAQIDSLRIYSVDTPTFTPTVSPTPTVTVSATATPTRTISATASPSATSSATTNPAFSPTFTPTVTASSSITPTRSVTSTRSITPTFTHTATATPTSTPVVSASAFFDHFTAGAPGTQPTGWFDASDGVSLPNPAQIAISNFPAATSYADVTVTGSTGFGNVTNASQTINLTTFPFLNVIIAELHSSTVVVTLFDNTVPAAPVAHRLNPVSIGAPGTYTFNIPSLTGLSGAVPVFIQLTVESALGNWAKFDLVDISSAAAITPTFTPTPVTTAPSNAFFDDFTNGAPPVIPPGWRDDTTNPGFGAVIRRDGTTYAVVSNTASVGFGKALSQVLTTNFDAFSEMGVAVTAMDPGTQLVMGIQMETSPFLEFPIKTILSPGIYTQKIPDTNTNSLTGTHTYSISVRINNGGPNSVQLDYVRIGVTSTPTITPTSTPTPVPNTFRPSANLFLPKEGTLKLNYTVQEPTRFRVTVFNLAGQVVRSLKNEDVKGTINGVLEWDGRNDNGAAVASGVYVIRLETDVYRQNIRVAVVK
jgi:hypothetical protein